MLSYFQRKPTTPEEIKDSRDARATLKIGIASAKEQLKSAIAINALAGFTAEDFKPVEDILKKADAWMYANPRPFAQESADQLESLLANLTTAYEDIKDRAPPRAPTAGTIFPPRGAPRTTTVSPLRNEPLFPTLRGLNRVPGGAIRRPTAISDSASTALGSTLNDRPSSNVA